MRINKHDYQYKIYDLAFIDTKECYRDAYQKHRDDLYSDALNFAYDYFLASAYHNNDFDIDFISDEKQLYFTRKIAEFLIEENPRIKKACMTQLFRELIMRLYEGAQEKVNQDIQAKRIEIMKVQQQTEGQL